MAYLHPTGNGNKYVAFGACKYAISFFNKGYGTNCIVE